MGITISRNLKWDSYINKIRAKSNALSHIIIHSFSPTNTQLITNLYKTYVRPIVEYNTSVWSPHTKSNIAAIESVQRRFTRKICKRSNMKYSCYDDRLVALNLESLESRRIKQDLFLFYKILHNIIDIDFSSLFEFSSLGGYGLRRHSMQVKRPANCKTLCRQNFFASRVVPVWNALPEDVVTAPTLSIFKNRVRTLHFLPFLY